VRGQVDPGGRDGQFQTASQPFSLDIEIDEDAGSVRVFDPRAFRADRRSFCRRLVEAAARRPNVSRVEVDLASASCRLEFASAAVTPQEMAGTFSDSVREAAAQAGPGGSSWWRPTGAWVALTAYSLAGGISIWESLEIQPGRIRIRHRRFKGDHVRPARLAAAVSNLPQVARACARPLSSRITIDFHRGHALPIRIIDDVERVWESLWAAGPEPRKVRDGHLAEFEGTPRDVATGLKRLGFLAMAGGSFALSLAGLIVPGIPTVPFLLATSYYLARSSPALDSALRHAPFLGPILTEWEQHHALGAWSKVKLIGLTVTIIVVTVMLTPVSLAVAVVIAAVGSLSVYGVARLPSRSATPAKVTATEPAARLALFAP
jgi:uncharacterized membrane protein YbaN (DUF454 family)